VYLDLYPDSDSAALFSALCHFFLHNLYLPAMLITFTQSSALCQKIEKKVVKDI